MADPLFAPDKRTLATYLGDLRSAKPTPGGGSASAYCGALGASLASMVCRLTIGKATSDIDTPLTELAESYDRIVDQLSQAAREDELSFARYQAATRLPRSTDDEKRIRSEARQSALRLAAEAPLTTAKLALHALESLPTIARLGTHHALADVETALIILLAGIDGALVSVQVNVDMITDEAIAAGFVGRVEQIRVRVSEAEARVRAEVAGRSG